ncbi:MAG: DUF547 domain-containing protein [Gammaproteobacteria bacterium]|nr:DUF547 domain-containing protein [Gammaproteobacteria bacterium]
MRGKPGSASRDPGRVAPLHWCNVLRNTASDVLYGNRRHEETCMVSGRTGVVTICFCIQLCTAAAAGTDTSAERGPGIAGLFQPYGELLASHLEEKHLNGGGLVSAFRYQDALADPRTGERIQTQRDQLAEFDPDRLQDKDAAIAFWLNAYNFFMVAHILEERPGGELVDSVWDYGGRYNPFRANVFERELFNVGGRQYSLDGIEKGTLLGEAFQEKGWKDARVHFAVNCASVGCPPLRDRAYTRDNVQALLSENTRRALLTERHMRFAGETLYLTQLFDWYEADFVEAAGSVRGFLKRHTDESRHPSIDAAAGIRFIDYDWALNSPDNDPAIE